MQREQFSLSFSHSSQKKYGRGAMTIGGIFVSEMVAVNTGKKSLPTSVNIEYSSSFKSARIVFHLA